MYSTAALMLANGHIADLMAEADAERRVADQVRSNRRRTADRSSTSRLHPLTAARRLIRIVRSPSRATAR